MGESGQLPPRTAVRGGALPRSGVSNVKPALVVYLSCGEENADGQVFQVDDNGRVLGTVKLPYAATGLALHRNQALIAVSPRDGGTIYRIDATGNVSTILEKQRELPHPVDVSVGAGSDLLLVADDVAHLLGTTSTAGGRPIVYHRFPVPRSDFEQMSVAVAHDKHVLFAGNGDPGVFRFSGERQSGSRTSLLPAAGGVAADTASAKWAATQPPDQIFVFAGEQVVERLRLPGNRCLYGPGLLSFGPAGCVVAAARDPGDPQGAPWLICFQAEEKQDRMDGTIRNLFKWQRARLVDFVVGPRMFWDRKSPSTYRSIY